MVLRNTVLICSSGGRRSQEARQREPGVYQRLRDCELEIALQETRATPAYGSMPCVDACRVCIRCR